MSGIGNNFNRLGSMYRDISAGFRKLKYLQSTGTQYINTKIPFNKELIISAIFKYNDVASSAGNQRCFGCYFIHDTNEAYSLGISLNHNLQGFASAYSTSMTAYTWQKICNIDTETHTFKEDFINKKAYVDNTSTNLNMFIAGLDTETIYIFGNMDYSKGKAQTVGNLCRGNYYQFKINDNVGLIMDLIPALCLAGTKYIDGNTEAVITAQSNKPGMFDLISKKFFTNIGSGQFLYGE